MGVIKHNLYFDGVNAREKEIVVYGGDVDEIAERDVNTVTVPGRNGVLHFDNGRWGERKQTYLAYLPGDNYPARIGYARTVFGRRGKGYKRLEDTFNPDVFSLASFVDAMKPESMAFRTMGLTELSFSCRPERFLRSGEKVIAASGAVTLMNPTGLPAKPLIRVYGTGGVLSVGGEVITISTIDGYVDLDSDTCDAFKGATNCNPNITLGAFPVFDEGTTGISWTGGITSVEIIPRWWRL